MLPLLALLPHAAGTSMKIDYLRLANVRTDPITHPDGPSPHVPRPWTTAGARAVYARQPAQPWRPVGRDVQTTLRALGHTA